MKRKLRLYSVILLASVTIIMVALDSFFYISNAVFTGTFWFTFLIFISLWLISFFDEGDLKNDSNTNNLNYSTVHLENNSSDEIPETCPHCKNPNSKKIRTCEWCGGQVY